VPLTRLNKIIADAGVASRRGADQLILDGRVTVDDQIVIELGGKFDPQINKITVDGEKINTKKSNSYIAFHKPCWRYFNHVRSRRPLKFRRFFQGSRGSSFPRRALDRDSEG
jgi:23S rRNA pseudouridine2605 synthase